MLNPAQPDSRVLARTSRVLTVGMWAIIGGTALYSLMTTTPFVAGHSAWESSGPVLGLMMDAAFVMSLQADSLLARYGVTDLGIRVTAFRWFTGLATLFLNVTASAQAKDMTGVTIHALAPLLLLGLAEVLPVWRRAMAGLITEAAAAEQQRAAELAAAEPEPEPEPEPEDDSDDEPGSLGTVTALPQPREPRSHRASSGARGKMAEGLALMRAAAANGEPLPTTEDLEKELGCTRRHAQNVVKRYNAAS